MPAQAMLHDLPAVPVLHDLCSAGQRVLAVLSLSSALRDAILLSTAMLPMTARDL